MSSILQPSTPDPNVRLLERISRLETEVTELRRTKGFYTVQVTLVNGWRPYANGLGAVWPPTIQATRTGDGIVMLEGLLDKPSALSAVETIGTLPSGFHPKYNAMYVVFASYYNTPAGTVHTVPLRVDVGMDGQIILDFPFESPQNYTMMHLSVEGITYRPD